jgi:hypothetical protein
VPAAGSVSVIETVVNNTPDKLQQLSRQIQVSGLLAAPPNNGSITLNTLIGPLTIMLPQLAQTQQDKLTQQLVAMFEGQRPLTVMVEPGNPPTQAFLLMPSTTPIGQNQSAATDAATTSSSTQISVNMTPIEDTLFSAVVLPKDISLPAQAVTQSPYGSPPPVSSFSPLPTNELADAALSTETAVIDQALAKLQGQVIPSLTNSLPRQSPTLPNSLPNMPNLSPIPTAPAQSSAFPSLPSSNFNLQAGVPLPSISMPTSTPASQGPVTPINFLQPGTELNLHVDAVVLPAQVATANLTPNAPNQFVATVAGNGPNGQLILKTGDSTLFVRQSADLPPGTQLLVTAEPARNTPALIPLPDQPAWANLQQVVSSLVQMNPSLAQNVIANHLPQPNGALPGALLFFLSAVRQGDVRSWLGNSAYDFLTRNGKYELIAKLAQDLQQGGQSVHDNVVGQWRSYPVPIYENQHFHMMHFYVHGDGHRRGSHGGTHEESRPTASQIRFLIDVRMSRLGALQLDGFVRKKQLDMIVRSEHVLPSGLDKELKQAYLNVLGAIDYAGTINFQTGRQNWINLQSSAQNKALVT